MLNETSTLYKLTIMYMLSRVDFPLSNSQISNYILENDYTDYFNIQQIMGELIDDGYVSQEALRGKTLYRLTDEGTAALKLLIRELSTSVKADVDEYIKNNKMQLREDLSIMSNYYETDLNQFIAHLYIEESGARIFEMNVAASTAEEADRICSGWQKGSERIYQLVISELLRT